MSTNDTGSTASPTPSELTFVSPAELGQSVGIYTMVAIFFFTLFFLLRCNKFFYSRVFYPLYPHDHLSEYDKANRKSKVKPPSNLLPFLFSDDREKEVLEEAGLDAYVTLRASRMPMLLFAALGVFSFLFLVPVYASKNEEKEFVTKISIASLDKGDPRDRKVFIWVFVVMLIFDIVVILLVKLEYDNFIRVRKEYFARRCRERYSVVVERVPKKLMSTKNIKRYFEVLMGVGTVHSVTLLPKLKLVKSLTKLIKKRDNTLISLEKVQVFNDRKTAKKSILNWDGDLNKVLADLQEFTFANLASVQELSEDVTVSPQIAALLSSDAFSDIEEHVKMELKGYMTWDVRVKKFINTISCGLLKNKFMSEGDATEVDAEEYYRLKLEIMNKLIALMQERANILLQVVEHDVESYQEEKEEPTFDEYTALLDTSHRKIRLVEEARLSAMSTVQTILLRKKEAPTEIDRLRDEFFKYVQMSAIVTFDNISAANTVAILAVDDENDTMRTTFAKQPEDMKYENFNYSILYKTGVTFVSFFFTIGLTISFTTLVFFLGFVTNLETLLGVNDFLDDVINAGDGFLLELSKQLAPFVFLIALTLVPPIMLFIYGLRKPIAQSDLEKTFFKAYYGFTVIQLFIFYQASSGVTAAFESIQEDPGEIFNILADAIPNNAVFFMQLTLIKAFLGLPLELTRLVAVILGVCLRQSLTCQSFESETDREKDSTKVGCLPSPQKPHKVILGKLNAETMLIYTIEISYSLIAPLMSALCFIYSVVFTLVMRNQFLFVYAQELKHIDSLGSQFQNVMDTFFVAIFLLTATMTGIFSLNELPEIAAFGFPTLVMIGLIRIYFQIAYRKELQGIPLALAKFYDVAKEELETVDHDDGAKTESIKEVIAEVEHLTGSKYFDYSHTSLQASHTETL